LRESIIVFNLEAAKFVQEQLDKAQVSIPVHVEAGYFF
jgi:hypothetical protein